MKEQIFDDKNFISMVNWSTPINFIPQYRDIIIKWVDLLVSLLYDFKYLKYTLINILYK